MTPQASDITTNHSVRQSGIEHIGAANRAYDRGTSLIRNTATLATAALLRDLMWDLRPRSAKEQSVKPSAAARKESKVRGPYKNSLLASLPALEIERLKPHFLPVTLSVNQTLHDAGEKVDTVYFLEDGICSIVAEMESGSTIEVGIIGRDGFVGMAAVLDAGRATNRSYMQIPGYGFSIKAKVLRARCDESAELRSSLLRGVQSLLVQTSQTAACNRVHELEERLARWLLMCHDRIQADFLPITHEFLGMMLGTRRTSVTVAAGMLQKAGLIAYSRGHVTIEDRDGLKDVACECYQVVQDEYARLGLL